MSFIHTFAVDAVTQTVLFFCVTFLALMAHTLMVPFKSAVVNVFQSFLLGILLLFIVLGLVFAPFRSSFLSSDHLPSSIRDSIFDVQAVLLLLPLGGFVMWKIRSMYLCMRTKGV
jgi:uncharacterized membrane protein YwzB